MPHDASEPRCDESRRARHKLGESPSDRGRRLVFVDIAAKELLVVTAADAADAADAMPKRVRCRRHPGLVR